MDLLWPPGLVFLLLIPVGIFGLRRLEARRRRSAAALSGTRAADAAAATPARAATRIGRRVPAVALTAGFLLLPLALARPEGTVLVPRDEGIVILAFDVSASMSATDLEPTRIAAAKAAAKEFVQAQRSGVVIGVVAFSDAGITTVPATTDQAAIVSAIDRLLPARGTSLGQGILASLHAIEAAMAGPTVDYYSNRSAEPAVTPTPVPAGVHAPASIVILTDGDNNEQPDPLTVAQSAADAGVRIYPVGIGSAAGTTVDLDGFQVHTALDEGLLRQIAEVSGGSYHEAQDSAGLLAVYDELDSSLLLRPEHVELTGLLAGVAGLLFLVGGVAAFAWLGRMP